MLCGKREKPICDTKVFIDQNIWLYTNFVINNLNLTHKSSIGNFSLRLNLIHK